MKKLRQWPLDVGVSAAAVSTHEPNLVQALVPLFQSLNWRGPADAEFKFDNRDGIPKLLEINPRFSGAIGFPIACGVNMPSLLCLAATGVTLPENRQAMYSSGTKYINSTAYLRSVVCGERARVPHFWTDPLANFGKVMLELRALAGLHLEESPGTRAPYGEGKVACPRES